MKEDQVEVGL